MTLGDKNVFISLVVEASRMLDTDHLRMMMDEMQTELTRREERQELEAELAGAVEELAKLNSTNPKDFARIGQLIYGIIPCLQKMLKDIPDAT